MHFQPYPPVFWRLAACTLAFVLIHRAAGGPENSRFKIDAFDRISLIAFQTMQLPGGRPFFSWEKQ